MSLITDALKMTQEAEAQAQPPAETKLETPVAPPVITDPPPPALEAAPPPVLALKVIIAASLGFVLLVVILVPVISWGWHKHTAARPPVVPHLTPAVPSAPAAAVVAQPVVPLPPPAPAELHHREPAIEQVDKFAAAPAPVVAPVEPPKALPPAPALHVAAPPVRSSKFISTPLTPVPAGEPPKLTLQGLLIDRQSREAMVNGFLVKEGDEVDGARVMVIEKQQIRFRWGGQEIVLRMQ